MEQLRTYNDPLLWTHVSSVLLSSDGTLNLRLVINTTNEVNTLGWLLMSSPAKDVRRLK